MSAGCAEMGKHHKMGHFVHLSETGDSPDTLIFYFQHNTAASVGRCYPTLMSRAIMNHNA